MKKIKLHLHLEFGLFDVKIFPSPRCYVARLKFDGSISHHLSVSQYKLWESVVPSCPAVWYHPTKGNASAATIAAKIEADSRSGVLARSVTSTLILLTLSPK